MHYFAKTKNGEAVPVDSVSVSPSGRYFVGRYARSREEMWLFRTVHKTDDAVYGEEVTSHHNYLDTETAPGNVVWYEEYGFAKLVFHFWGSMDSKSVRLFFDRELYERKKKERNGE